MNDYVEAVRRESVRFAAVLAGTELTNPVPSCPDWDVADLIWHLMDVQHFWASIVEDLLEDPGDVPPFERPAPDLLLEGFVKQSARLGKALESHQPEEQCWSWHDDGHSVGWVRRRQAHEALIHRVDAELAAGISPVLHADLAADGVDEIFRYSLDLDNLPDWATYEPDGTTATVALLDGSASWSMNFGRFLGSSPVSGNDYDLPALKLARLEGLPDATIRGEPADLDLWLWGRGPLDHLSIDGDQSIAEKLRRTAADSTT
ncbi:MAG: maleylpyruvate isomerase family mycothiol-dependent enzyme [Acidimicrobiia bacterium]|nr:maleylpyruvate isomerase family mycothiol-dependent enzyme [Acidimicrobiia bacterium]